MKKNVFLITLSFILVIIPFEFLQSNRNCMESMIQKFFLTGKLASYKTKSRMPSDILPIDAWVEENLLTISFQIPYK
jgi:hypothetical protein